MHGQFAQATRKDSGKARDGKHLPRPENLNMFLGNCLYSLRIFSAHILCANDAVPFFQPMRVRIPTPTGIHTYVRPLHENGVDKELVTCTNPAPYLQSLANRAHDGSKIFCLGHQMAALIKCKAVVHVARPSCTRILDAPSKQ